jgi:tRNA-splicing ligase RtcB
MEQIMNKLINFASILEPKTKSQACETASMDFIYPHLALMPDAHLGLGATVGSVIPTKGAIMPAAVGVDIGCGMMAVRTQFTRKDFNVRLATSDVTLADLHAAISKAVPLSAGGRNQKVGRSAKQRVEELMKMPGVDQADEVLSTWSQQLGSLGSGNHFIEISEDENGDVWLFLHSGSRGVGNKIAQRHVKVAKAYCKDNGYRLPNQDLAYLEEGTQQFDDYIEGLKWAQHFALLNRQEMMDRVVDCVSTWMGQPVQRFDEVNCHHNYTEKIVLPGGQGWEDHDVELYLSRKGAIDATTGTMGLIPGSMGDLSYVVRGRGNTESLWSAPHGAGRNFSRSAAKARFTRDDLDERMKGIEWGNSDAFLDEHPLAYKPIDQVMKDAENLVEIVHELRQFVNVKGN